MEQVLEWDLIDGDFVLVHGPIASKTLQLKSGAYITVPHINAMEVEIIDRSNADPVAKQHEDLEQDGKAREIPATRPDPLAVGS